MEQTRAWSKRGSVRPNSRMLPVSLLGLVVIARAKHPIPSRTRPLSAVAPMVLRLKTWESRSPPNLKRNTRSLNTIQQNPDPIPREHGAGWSSPVARQAHNLKVTGSNPVPATIVSALKARTLCGLSHLALCQTQNPCQIANKFNVMVSVRPDCPAGDRVVRIVSAMDSGHYGVAGGASNEAALVG